jgi:hypothetical protein
MARPPPPLRADDPDLADYIEKSPERPPRTDDEKIADEELAMHLLAGKVGDHRGRKITSYLKHNSQDERLARSALARLVRESMRGLTGELLALALDPRTPSLTLGMRPTRKIRFEKQGKADNWVRDLGVINCIVNDLCKLEHPPLRGSRLKRAVATAAAEHGIGVSRAYEIWERRGKPPRYRSGK